MMIFEKKYSGIPLLSETRPMLHWENSDGSMVVVPALGSGGWKFLTNTDFYSDGLNFDALEDLRDYLVNKYNIAIVLKGLAEEGLFSGKIPYSEEEEEPLPWPRLSAEEDRLQRKAAWGREKEANVEAEEQSDLPLNTEEVDITLRALAERVSAQGKSFMPDFKPSLKDKSYIDTTLQIQDLIIKTSQEILAREEEEVQVTMKGDDVSATYIEVGRFPSSTTAGKYYTIKKKEGTEEFSCDCPIWIFNKRNDRTCKHTDMLVGNKRDIKIDPNQADLINEWASKQAVITTASTTPTPTSGTSAKPKPQSRKLLLDG